MSDDSLISELLSQKDRLKGYASRRMRDTSQVEDVVQEALLRIVEQMSRTTIENPLAYAYRVLDSVIYAQHRKAPVIHDPVDEQIVCDQPLVDEQVEYRERFRQFAGRLSDMPPLRRQVFVMRHIDGLSRDAIAVRLGLSVEAVKKHLVRAMSDLARANLKASGKPGLDGAPKNKKMGTGGSR